MDEGILILADRTDADHSASTRRSEVVADREQAAAALGASAYRVICLDHSAVESTLADARWLRRRRNRLPVIAVVDTADVERASELFACGVQEIVVRDASTHASLRARVDELVRRREPAPPLRAASGIVAHSASMRACLELVRKAQSSDATVLLLGETGTGKEVVARALHDGGRRARGPFVAINCAAFPETLLESELFGHDRGAFTGASRTRPGLFVAANGGTLFLDEIGETTLGFQVKLLRVLQEGVVRALGAQRETRVDVRIVAATNRDLAREVDCGRFRRDLYFRLNVFPISLPPLRSRTEDVVPLVLQFLAASGEPTGSARGRGRRAPPARDLRLAGQRARARERGRAHHHARRGRRRRSPRACCRRSCAASRPVCRATRRARRCAKPSRASSPGTSRRTLERNANRRVVTARELGITRECLYKKLRRYGLQ